MSGSQWTQEHEYDAGRRHVSRRDHSGAASREYQQEEEGQPSSRYAPSSRDRLQAPRSESVHRDPKRTSTYIAASIDRRGSISSRRPEPPAIPRGERSNTDPIKICNNSTSRYEDDTVDDNYREHRKRPASSSASKGGRPDERQYSTRENLRSTEEETLRGFGALTLDETTSQDYTTSSPFVSASAPAARGNWPNTVGSPRTSSQLVTEGHQRHEERRPLNRTTLPAISHPSSHQNQPNKSQSSLTGGRYGPDINGTKGTKEKLDPNYRVRKSDYKTYFGVGRVFSTLWTSPHTGPENTQSEHNQFMTIYPVSFGEKVYTKIRRFVVVRASDRACNCLPITTYSGQSYHKRGIEISEHGFIYSGSDAPKLVTGMTKSPLKVDLARNAEPLLSSSCINYGRIYNVECNVKVRDVGELDSKSKRLLRKYYDEVHHPQIDDIPGALPLHQGTSNSQLAGLGAGVSERLRYAPPATYDRVPTILAPQQGNIAHNATYSVPLSPLYSDPNRGVNNSYAPQYNPYPMTPSYHAENSYNDPGPMSSAIPTDRSRQAYSREPYQPPAQGSGYAPQSGRSSAYLPDRYEANDHHIQNPYPKLAPDSGYYTQHPAQGQNVYYSAPAVAMAPQYEASVVSTSVDGSSYYGSQATEVEYQQSQYVPSQFHHETVAEEDEINLPTPAEIHAQRSRRDSNAESRSHRDRRDRPHHRR